MLRRLSPLVGLGVPVEAADSIDHPVDLDAGKNIASLTEGDTHSNAAMFAIHHVDVRRLTAVPREVLEKGEHVDDLAFKELKIGDAALLVALRNEVLDRLGLEPIGQEELVRLDEPRIEVEIQIDRQIADRSGPYDVRRHGKPRGCRWDRAE